MDIWVICIITGALCLISQVSCQCSFGGPFFISETDKPGFLIFNITKPSGSNASLRVEDTGTPPNPAFVSEVEGALKITNYDTTFTLTNTKVLDLEVFKIDYNRVISTLDLKITCGGKESTVLLSVTHVNEFAPVFVGSPYNITIPESTNIKDVVFNLKPKVTDQDVGVVQNFYFRIQLYNIIDFDGRAYFDIGATSEGNIVLNRTLDYDAPGSRNEYRLNISVSDGQTGTVKTTYTDVVIYVTDVDDQNPYFSFPNCPKPCPAPPYQSTIRLAYTGPLTIIPNSFNASDADTLGTPLRYSIKSGNTANMFEINPVTGDVTQRISVNQANLPDAFFRLVIEVRKDKPGLDLSSIAILTIRVWERLANDSGLPVPPVGKSTDSDSGSDLIIPLAVIGVILLIVIVALVIVFIKYRREVTVVPADDKSEPQTEEEDLPTDGEEYNSNEKIVVGNKTTLGIMTDEFPETEGERANRLPPLPMRDTATETTEGKKKKSRKRNKNKEPEIFDGTREYNMGLDPEFFDSTDKSKVKRSQRSRKVDSSLPIKVANDNMPDEESSYQ